MRDREKLSAKRDGEKAPVCPDCEPNCNRYHTRTEVAAILGVHPDTVFELERRGLKVSRKTGAIRIHHSWIRDFMEN